MYIHTIGPVYALSGYGDMSDDYITNEDKIGHDMGTTEMRYTV
jgi:hypothetical protein